MKDLVVRWNVRLWRDEPFVAAAGWVCAAFGLFPLAITARGLARQHATPADFALGVTLAAVAGILFIMLGLLVGSYAGWSKRLPFRQRGWEWASYVACMALMVGGILPMPGLGLSQAQVIHAALAVGDLSVSVLVLGMLSSVLRALKNRPSHEAVDLAGGVWGR